MSAEVMPAIAGDFAVLTPVVSEGKFVGLMPHTIIAFRVVDGAIDGYVTPVRVFPLGSAILDTVEGVVITPDNEWETYQLYEDHMRRGIQ